MFNSGTGHQEACSQPCERGFVKVYVNASSKNQAFATSYQYSFFAMNQFSNALGTSVPNLMHIRHLVLMESSKI